MAHRLMLAAFGLALGCVAAPGDNDGSGGSSGDDASGDDATDGQATNVASDDCTEACGTDQGSDDAMDETGAPGELDCADTIDNDDDQQVDCADSDCAADEACSDGTIRIATWNILRVDPIGSDAYEALVAIVLRLDADILCVQEVGEGEESQLQALAVAGGYNYGLLTPPSGVPGKGIANACMSRFPTLDASYLWSNWISSDPSAQDLTRPLVRLRFQHPGSGRYVSILSGHLKAGGEDIDRFRRMVDTIRLGQAAQAEHDEYPGNAVIALGDFNEGANPPTMTFTQLPPGLPAFYKLGNDISFPIAYAPSQPLVDAGLNHVDARWEDGTQRETFIPISSRLDYIYVSGEEVVASEVYEACNDDGIDAAPVGDMLAKAGDPLQCGTSERASDHRPVIVQLRL